MTTLKNLNPLITLLILFRFSIPAIAQDGGSAADEAQANNPLANFKAFNVQNYYVPTLSGGVEGSVNTFWFRYAQPLGRFLMRASLPLNRFPTGSNQHESGLGDFGIFAAYLIDTGNPSRSFGIGPQLSAPTATEDALGSGKWQAGLATVYFDASSPTIQWGGLYMRGAPIWAFNLESGNYHVPIGLGIGKVVRSGKVVYNFFIEPPFTVLDRGPGQPEIQFYMALNMQFK